MAKISGGDKLRAALDDISKKVSKASSVEIGFLEGSTFTDGTSIPMVAAIQEFGSAAKGIPARPFFRTMIKEKSDEWPDAIAGLLVENGYDSEKTMRQTGAAIEQQLRESIIGFNGAPLSPVTVMLRGMRTQAKYQDMPFWDRFAIAKQRVADGKTNYGASTTPLIDTGQMLKSISSRVK